MAACQSARASVAILRYTASNAKTPPPSACTLGKATGSTWEPASWALQPLLELECETGQCLNETMHLEKHVGLDGTTVRTCWITPRSTKCLDHTKFRSALQVRKKIGSVASRASCNLQEEVESVNQERLTNYTINITNVTSRTSYNSGVEVNNVASGTSYNLQEKSMRNVKSALHVRRKN